MATKFDTVWFWLGGREVGRWEHTLGWTPTMRAEVERGGRVAVDGKLSVGAPEGAPSPERFAALGL